MVENLGDEHCLVCNSICESVDFQSRLRLLLIVPFYIPVDRRRFRRFYEHRGRINCNSAMGRKCSQVWYYSLRKDDAQSLIQGAFLHLCRKFWTALLEMSGEELLGLLADGVPDSAAAATGLPLKRAEEFNMAAFLQSNPQLIIPVSLDIQMLVWDSLFACERNSEQHCTAWKVKSAEST
ncbi:unnamed protein product [Sphagnum jensenii]